MADVTAAGSGGAGLGTPGARWAFCAVWALGVLSEGIGATWGPPSAWRLLGYATALVGVLVTTTPGDRTLDRPRAVVVDLAMLASVGALLASGPEVERIWLFDFASYLGALLVARGNVIAGAAGSAVVILGGAGWGLAVAGPGPGVVGLVVTPIMALVVGFIWRAVLRRIVAQERLHRTEAARAELSAQLADEAAAADRRDLAEIGEEAGPLLARLAEGLPINERWRREIEVVEAGIRDRVRSPWLLGPALDATIADRRRAGLDVVLLGERPGPRQRIGGRLGTVLHDIVVGAERGSVTIRAVPPGRAAAVSVLLDDGETAPRLLLLDEDGQAVSRPTPSAG
ncbi:MAG: hypothetical protein BGO95_11595 [Micrococcales bacterium 73-13]|nr:MAG: hypothetical protein BGO95_11595 [Micrococcales bacterium 73-13]